MRQELSVLGRRREELQRAIDVVLVEAIRKVAQRLLGRAGRLNQQPLRVGEDWLREAAVRRERLQEHDGRRRFGDARTTVKTLSPLSASPCVPSSYIRPSGVCCCVWVS